MRRQNEDGLDDVNTRETKRRTPYPDKQNTRVSSLIEEQRQRDQLVADQVASARGKRAEKSAVDDVDDVDAVFDVAELARILEKETPDATERATLESMCTMWRSAVDRKAEKARWSKGLVYVPLIEKAHRKIVWYKDTPVFGADISDGRSEFTYINSDGASVVMTFTLSLSKSDVCVGKDYLFVSDKKHIEYVHWSDNTLSSRQVEHTAIAEAWGNLYYAFEKDIYLFDPIHPLINKVCTMPYRINRLAMHEDMIVYSTSFGVVQQWSLGDQCRVCDYITRNDAVIHIAISAGFVCVRTPSHMLFFGPVDVIMDKSMLPNRKEALETHGKEITLGYNDGSFIISYNSTLFRMGIEETQILSHENIIDASFSKSGKLGVLGESIYGENKSP